VSLELPAVIHFLWPKHTPNYAILSELQENYGRDVTSLRAVEMSTSAFDDGRTELVDLSRFGRPYDTGTVDAVRGLIEDERHLYWKNIAQMLGIHHETVKRILRDNLNMHKVNFKRMCMC
jgi:hypothetical protein